jgi:hypothetical protein
MRRPWIAWAKVLRFLFQLRSRIPPLCEVVEKVAAGDRRTQVRRQWLCWWRQGDFSPPKSEVFPGKEGGIIEFSRFHPLYNPHYARLPTLLNFQLCIWKMTLSWKHVYIWVRKQILNVDFQQYFRQLRNKETGTQVHYFFCAFFLPILRAGRDKYCTDTTTKP